ncbi:MAG: hypothetical protein IAC23_05980 [Bacteroidetes bacterium]|uniref:Uncharacterized protein n=1 Tax=Candidatus Cryptobacteroides merdavium TaxID=2840769 RepID=A0A9D9EHS3_9BACT|nr:hypothetical protein [Candidatus Cryptobacteroides merdavium]
MKLSDNLLKEQDESCDSPPGEGRERFMRMSGGHSQASSKGRVTHLDKGLSRSDWGLRQTDFEEIHDDSSTNSLGASIINSSN